jgi:PAS domain S-box-containing protein
MIQLRKKRQLIKTPHGILISHLWIWVALMLSLLVCGSISWIHQRQKDVLGQTFVALENIRQTRIDLAKGFIHLRFSKDSRTPFSREQGLALLQQAVFSMENAIHEDYEFSNLLSNSNDISEIKLFKKKIQIFKDTLRAWQSSPNNNMQLETTLRMTFYDLERQAEAIDIETQNSIRIISNRLDTEFMIILWVAALFLVCICVAIFFTGKAKQIADEALSENTQLLESVIENSPSLVYIFDKDGRCLLSNRRHSELFNTNSDEMEGSFRQTWMDDSFSESHRNNDLYVLKTGMSGTFEEESLQKDGLHIYLTTKFPITDNKGIMYGVGGISTDITERKFAEQYLREAKERAEINDKLNSDILKKLNEAQHTAKIGSWDWDMENNTFWWSDELYNIFDLDPETFLPSVESSSHYIHPDDAKTYTDAIEESIHTHVPLDCDLRIISGRGILKHCNIHGISEYNDNGEPIRFFGTFFDITERKKADEQIRKALVEKETLLRELYHRTKNNMQVIRSILSLQASHSKNDEVKKVLHEASNRIQSMALVHQKLYQAKDLSRISLKDYVLDLASLVLQSYDTLSHKVSLETDLADIYVLIDTAIPCGLIINELLSNTLKHAFMEDKKGVIRIKISKAEDGTITINYSDNGNGVPENFDFRGQKSLGLQTIFAIAEDQLKGKIDFSTVGGISCTISFNDTYYKPRV